jgi:hypothetical protein
MGDLLIGSVYPPSLGNIQKMMVGTEQVWPRQIEVITEYWAGLPVVVSTMLFGQADATHNDPRALYFNSMFTGVSPYDAPPTWYTGLTLDPSQYELGESKDGAEPVKWFSPLQTVNNPVLGITDANNITYNTTVLVRLKSNQALVKVMVFYSPPAVATYTPPLAQSYPKRMGSLLISSSGALQTKGVFHNSVDQHIGSIDFNSFEVRVTKVSGGQESPSKDSPLNTWLGRPPANAPLKWEAQNQSPNRLTLKVEVRNKSTQAIVSTWWIALYSQGSASLSKVSYSALP